jgi:hypothetical protein
MPTAATEKEPSGCLQSNHTLKQVSVFYMKINSPGLAGSAGGCIAEARLAGESGPKG